MNTAYIVDESIIAPHDILPTMNEMLNTVKLTTREGDIIYKYYVLERSLASIAVDYDVTTEKIRWIRAKILRKLRNTCKKYN